MARKCTSTSHRDGRSLLGSSHDTAQSGGRPVEWATRWPPARRFAGLIGKILTGASMRIGANMAVLINLSMLIITAVVMA